MTGSAAAGWRNVGEDDARCGAASSGRSSCGEGSEETVRLAPRLAVAPGSHLLELRPERKSRLLKPLASLLGEAVGESFIPKMSPPPVERPSGRRLGDAGGDAWRCMSPLDSNTSDSSESIARGSMRESGGWSFGALLYIEYIDSVACSYLVTSQRFPSAHPHPPSFRCVPVVGRIETAIRVVTASESEWWKPLPEATMTGYLGGRLLCVSAFAASVAPRLQAPLYALLGMLASMAYDMGAMLRPLTPRTTTSDEPVVLSDTEQHMTSAEPEMLTCQHMHRGLLGLAVVIPAFVKSESERAVLQLCVQALKEDKAVKDIIVVNDASPTSLNLVGCRTVHHSTNSGPAAARNTGMRIAFEVLGADAVAFTDADCVPSDGWASAHQCLQEKAPGIFAGLTLAAGTDTISRFHDAMGTLMPRRLLDQDNDDVCDEALYGPTCNLSISSQVAAAIKFDTTFPTSAFEDCDFCVRARDAGFKVHMSNQPVIYHHYTPSVSGLVRTFHKYGRSLPLMMAKHAHYGAMLAGSAPTSAVPPTDSTAKFRK